MDDLLDLEWDKKPSVSTSLQSANKSSYNSSYNFDALTRSLPQQQQNAGHKINQSSASTITAKTHQSNNLKQANTDAFSSLLGFESSNSSSKSGSSTNISMAERLKRDQQQKLGISSGKNTPALSASPADSAWEGLDTFLVPGKTSKPASSKSNGHQSTLAKSKEAASTDIWDFSTDSAFSSKKASTSSPKKALAKVQERVDSQAGSLFDFSEFEDPGKSQSSALGESIDDSTSTKRGAPRIAIVEDDEEDFLSAFNRPAPSSSRQQPSSKVRPAHASATDSKSRSVSPPPHIIGKIIEMGFSPQQARQALAATESGLDLTAAIESLLSQAQSTPSERHDDYDRDKKMAMRLQQDEERENNQRRREKSRRSKVDEELDSVSNGLDIPLEWQKQADQIYNQASEIGASVFSKANALWSTAKAQAQRAIDERSGNESGVSSGRSSPATGSDRARSRRWAVPSREAGSSRKEWQGKPKWMTDAEIQENETEKGEREQSSSGFRDDEDIQEVVPAKPFIQQKSPPVTSSTPAVRDIWSQGERVDSSDSNGSLKPLPSQEPRRSSPLSNVASAPVSSSNSSNGTTTRQRQQAGSKTMIKKQRSVIADDADALRNSSNLRERGNEFYKRGAYGEAEIAYSNALEAIEATSLRRVVLLNNRANARLKNGDARNALNDTKDVLTLIVVMGENGKGSPFLLYRPSMEEPLPLPEYADINLRDGYAKALLRRAQAEEMLEQWETAQSVWSLLEKYEREEGSGKSGIVNLRAAQDGKKRCNKMVKGGDIELAPQATRRVHAAAVQAVAKAEKAAKDRIRKENAVADAEEAEKDRLRDSVDARVTAWKNGKEANVRALLASLHDVVWASLGWKKVGMHELVMDNQVKRTYMRAIGKLHPDKLTPKTNTIEERMIGGAVFSVLNDAWSAANST